MVLVEKTKKICPKCGTELKHLLNGDFRCPSCNIDYEDQPFVPYKQQQKLSITGSPPLKNIIRSQ